MALQASRKASGSDSIRNRLDVFEEVLESNFGIVQEMAYEGDIFDPGFIKLCREHGIKFKKDFLKSIGLKED